METQRPQKMKQSIKYLPYCVFQHPFLQSISLLLAVIVFSFSNISYADVTSVNSIPSSITIPVRGAAPVNLTWQVSRTVFNPNLPTATVSVSSAMAQLQISGSNVATLAGLISTLSTLGPGQSETVTLRETFTINTALARRIASSPAGSVRIIRSFTDTQGVPRSGTIAVSSGSANSGPLSIRRIDIAFENDARTDVIHKADKIRAVADISFRSSGFLRGEWRIVDPTASLGNSGGRILQVIQQNLVSSGEGRVRITSPILPANESGLYFVTFSVQQTNANFITPILRYFVLADKKSQQPAKPLVVKIFSPKDSENLDRNTEFSWAKIKGAMAYQIELFKQGENNPITGKLVPANELKLSLSALSLELLKPGYDFSWRIRAFNQQGRVIGLSELHVISTP